MKQFKNELEGKVVKWTDSPVGTFTVEEILGEKGNLMLKMALAGYKPIKD